MIKTLRITSIIAAIVATILLIIPAVYGVRKDSKMEEFLKTPGVVEKYTATKGQNPTKKDTESPLVQAAATYKNIINPPPPPPPKVVPGAPAQGSGIPAPPVAPVAKFDLVATSYCAADPKQSLALIDEAGKGLHWVRQGEVVGRVTISTVKDGAIVVSDGQRNSEMNVKVEEKWRTLLKNPPPPTRPGTVTTSSAAPATVTPAVIQGAENPAQPVPTPTARPGMPPQLSGRRSFRPGTNPAAGRITSPAQPADSATAQQGLPAVQNQPAAEVIPASQEPIPAPVESVSNEDETETKIKNLVGEPGKSKITNEEAAKLKKLSEELKSEMIDPDDAEKKLEELNNLIEQLEEKTRTSGQPVKSQSPPVVKPRNSK